MIGLKKQYVETRFGNIAYMEAGANSNPPVLLVHGIPTSSFLWRHVMDILHNDFHCYAPDLMGLGDTDVDPESNHFHMDAQAHMLLYFMTALGHESFGVVCHDQGGAAVQLIAAQNPERLRCLVITDSVCYDNWPTPTIKRVQRLTRRLPYMVRRTLTRIGFFEWRETSKRFSSFRRAVYNPDCISKEAICEYLRPMRTSVKGAKRFEKYLLAGNPSFTLKAIKDLRRFRKPTSIIWAADDTELSPSWGLKLRDDIPGVCQFELIPFCGHFWQEERPEAFAQLIGEFLAQNCYGR
jgi:pimeloyl-ACP methyl ester carboxylesterase